MTREQALTLLDEPLYDPEQLEPDQALLMKKFGYTAREWENLLTMPTKAHTDYKTSVSAIKYAMRAKTLQNAVSLLLRGNFSDFFQN